MNEIIRLKKKKKENSKHLQLRWIVVSLDINWIPDIYQKTQN